MFGVWLYTALGDGVKLDRDKSFAIVSDSVQCVKSRKSSDVTRCRAATVSSHIPPFKVLSYVSDTSLFRFLAFWVVSGHFNHICLNQVRHNLFLSSSCFAIKPVETGSYISDQTSLRQKRQTSDEKSDENRSLTIFFWLERAQKARRGLRLDKCKHTHVEKQEVHISENTNGR